MDTRKLDMVFFMTLENGKDLTFKEIEEIANKYSARSLWYLWRHTQRYRKYINKWFTTKCQPFGAACNAAVDGHKPDKMQSAGM